MSDIFYNCKLPLLQLKCCGNKDYTNWFDVDWSGDGKSNSVPTSCCHNPEQCKHTDLPLQPGNDTADIFTEASVVIQYPHQLRTFIMVAKER